MRVTDVEVFKVFAGWRNWVFVKVHTDAGIYGVGEATMEGKEQAVEGAVRDCAPQIIGRDPRQIVRHVYTLYRDGYWRGGPVTNTAISALEVALWDIAGKAYGQPVHALLGGPMRDRVRAYANGWYFGAKTVEEFAQRARDTVQLGYTALKWDPFGRADLNISRDEEEFAIACVRGVREAVGPRVDLLIEAHGRFNPATALRMAHRLQPYDVFWLEEPVPPENVDALRKVAERSPVPIATGERLYTKFDYARLLPTQAADYIQPDVIHAGGILETLKIAAMAEAWYVPVAPHNPNGPVAMAATLQVAACTPNFVLLEYLMCDPPWCRQVVQPYFEIEDGCVRIPSAPGLGIDLVGEELARHPYRPMTLSFFSEESVLERPITPPGAARSAGGREG